MPKFASAKLEKLQLPSSTPDDPAHVTLDMNLSGGFLLDAMEGGDNKFLPATLIASVIKEWNFTGEDGNIAPITPDNVRRLSMADIAAISDKVFGAFDSILDTPVVAADEKKD